MRLRRKSGLLFLALYLKELRSSLQSAYGGVKGARPSLSVPVSLNRSGYPRIIPAHHRRIIMGKDKKRAETLVQVRQKTYISKATLALQNRIKALFKTKPILI